LKVLNIEPDEAAMMLTSFAIFFLMLCGYYILRPIRESCGVVLGKDALARTFGIVFVVMLLMVPVFGLMVAKINRRILLPVIFTFFASNILLFWYGMGPTDADKKQLVFQSLMGGEPGSSLYASLAPFDPSWAQLFFVWVSVYNLFTPSLFWSMMVDVFRPDQGKRLFGPVAAGGTFGGIAGSAITTGLAARFGPSNLLLVSVACLGAAIALSLTLRRLAGERANGEPQSSAKLAEAGLFDGALKVLTTPFMLRIALYIFIGNAVTTYFYLEQSRIVGETLTDPVSRQAFFANRDLVVSILTVTMELFVVGRLMQAYGVLPSLTLLPLSACLCLICYTLAPSLHMIAAVMVIERSLAYAISNPALKVLWTTVKPEDKYRCQNFVDTVVARGGDASSGTIFGALAKATAGLGGGGLVAIAAIPIALLWTYTGRALAIEQRARDAKLSAK
jgi:ATP:ADP antiporter, AAA family